MDEFVLAYVTTPNQDSALVIARTLVQEKLAACANLLPGMTSVYQWKGSLHQDSECVLILKTRRDLQTQVIERVRSLHSYETPCVIFIPITAGSPDYLNWLLNATHQKS